MHSGTYRFAGRTVRINSIYETIHKMCSGYEADGEADLEVNTTQENIELERVKSAAEEEKEGIPHVEYTDDYLETLAVYRQIADRMCEYDTILFHGSVIAVDGEAFLFTAKSGTGKSTHTRLWRKYFGERAYMVNDDKPLLRITDKQVIACGTPWDGKHHLSRNTEVPLKGLCILERAEKNSIVPVTKREAYDMLVQQVYRPCEPQRMIKVLKLIDRLAANVSLYRLGCNMDIEAAETAYNGMKG